LGTTGVERAIVGASQYPMEVRSIALAITRVELANRTRPERVIEYAYVALRLPRWRGVTVGAIQFKAVGLLSSAAFCSCSSRRKSMLHYISAEHQAFIILAHVSALASNLGDIRHVANAYNKGASSVFLKTQTIYSEVIALLAADGTLMMASSRFGRETTRRTATPPPTESDN
jgi:hypothetical protein